MREVISLHIGQAGIQIGISCWELISLEHGIQPDGSGWGTHSKPTEKAFSSFFAETEDDIYTPRCLFIDSERTRLDRISFGAFHDLFHPHFLISGQEDAANNFGRGYIRVQTELLPVYSERLRNLAELCDNPQGYIIFNALGGGTGSGLGSAILEYLAEEEPKTSKLSLCVWPSPRTAGSVVESYNGVLATSRLIDYTDVAVVLDNEALYDICSWHLSVERPSLKNVNCLISQAVSSLTASLRFDGALNVDLAEYQTNLVPYPRIRFMLTSYAPIIACNKRHLEKSSVYEMTLDAFSRKNVMAKCDLRFGKYMACCLMYRGDVLPKDVNAACAKARAKEKLDFVDWCPTGFKCGINNDPPHVIPGGDMAKTSRAVCMIANSTAVAEVFSRMDRKFDLMFAKRAFVHWFTNEGLEVEQFVEARESLAALELEYEEVTIGSEFIMLDESDCS